MIHRAELLISHLLRFGVLTCGALIGFGWILSLIASSHGQGSSALETLRQGHSVAQTLVYHSPAELFAALEALRPDAWMFLGLILLILLPVLRVALTVVVFWMEKDRIYLALSSTVLAILIFSAFSGRAL